MASFFKFREKSIPEYFSTWKALGSTQWIRKQRGSWHSCSQGPWGMHLSSKKDQMMQRFVGRGNEFGIYSKSYRSREREKRLKRDGIYMKSESVTLLEWEAIPFTRGSSWPRDQTWVYCTAGTFLTIWTTRDFIYIYMKYFINIYNFGWFMLLYGRNQHNIVKQLSSN